jgi:hypothetical protein
MFTVIPIKIPMTFFTEIEKSILMFIAKHRKPRIVKTVVNKKSNAGDNTILDFKLYGRARRPRNKSM